MLFEAPIWLWMYYPVDKAWIFVDGSDGESCETTYHDVDNVYK